MNFRTIPTIVSIVLALASIWFYTRSRQSVQPPKHHAPFVLKNDLKKSTPTSDYIPLTHYKDKVKKELDCSGCKWHMSPFCLKETEGGYKWDNSCKGLPNKGALCFNSESKDPRLNFSCTNKVCKQDVNRICKNSDRPNLQTGVFEFNGEPI